MTITLKYTSRIIVVAISGASGCGKTSVVKLLSKMFNCPYLLFDDHIDKNSYPKDMKNWLGKGANVSDIKTPKLVDSLRNLILTSNSQFVFIEEPFGRERDSIASLIDYVVLLDMPLEICLSRIIKRNIENYGNDALAFIPNYLGKYEDHLRDVYLEAVNQVRQNSDLIINQVDSISVVTNTVANQLK